MARFACITIVFLALGLLAGHRVVSDGETIVEDAGTPKGGLRYEVFGGLVAAVYGNPDFQDVFVMSAGDIGHSERFTTLVYPYMLEDDPSLTYVVLARTGCTLEDTGDSLRSSGPIHIHNRGDHYTPTAIDMYAKALKVMRERYNPVRVNVLGHSGGAATVAIVLGRYPSLIDAAVLMALPADLRQWRRHRQCVTNERGIESWSRSISPSSYVRSIRPDIPVAVLVGSKDDNTIPALSIDYVEAAHQAGLYNVRLVISEGSTHGGRFRYNNHDMPYYRCVQWMLTAPTGPDYVLSDPLGNLSEEEIQQYKQAHPHAEVEHNTQIDTSS